MFTMFFLDIIRALFRTKVADYEKRVWQIHFFNRQSATT